MELIKNNESFGILRLNKAIFDFEKSTGEKANRLIVTWAYADKHNLHTGDYKGIPVTISDSINKDYIIL